MRASNKKIVFSVFCVFVLILCLRYWGNIVGLLTGFLSAASPLILGCIIAYAVNILMSFYEKYYVKIFKGKKETVSSRADKVRRPLCMILAFFTLFLLVFLIVQMVVPELVSAITVLVNRVPAQIQSLVDGLDENSTTGQTLYDLYNTYIGSSAELQEMLESIVDAAKSGMVTGLKNLISTVSSLFSSLVVIGVGLIFSIYILLDKEHLQAQIKKLMETYIPAACNKTFYVCSVLNSCFHSFIVGQCTEAVILGVLCIIGMTIFRFPYAGMIGTLIGFTALIPVAGAYIGGIVGALMMLTQSPVTAVYFLIYLVILQQLENNLIYPRVVGTSLGLSGIWVLAAVTVGGSLMGVAGMLIGVPLFAAIYRIVQTDMIRRDQAKEASETLKQEPESSKTL